MCDTEEQNVLEGVGWGGGSQVLAQGCRTRFLDKVLFIIRPAFFPLVCSKSTNTEADLRGQLCISFSLHWSCQELSQQIKIIFYLLWFSLPPWLMWMDRTTHLSHHYLPNIWKPFPCSEDCQSVKDYWVLADSAPKRMGVLFHRYRHFWGQVISLKGVKREASRLSTSQWAENHSICECQI